MGGPKEKGDARVELALPGESEGFRFAVEVKARATPQIVQWAMTQARAAAQEGEWPMIQVPFLSSERLDELEREQVSGVELCGNGVVVVPGRLWVVRSGAPNRYRDSRPLSNPYRGRSAMVARMLLQRPRWQSLSGLTAAIQVAGVELSLPQASDAGIDEAGRDARPTNGVTRCLTVRGRPGAGGSSGEETCGGCMPRHGHDDPGRKRHRRQGSGCGS